MSIWDGTLLTVGWLLGVWLMARTPPPTGAGERAAAATSISVIIPARNEAASLPHLLASLAAQDRAAQNSAVAEVIVVDDASTDDTAALARQAGVTVLAAPPPPPHVSGKPAAAAAGAAAAHGQILVFLDADVRLAPTALQEIAGEVRSRGGLVSVQPYHRTERAYERLSAVCNTVSMMGSLAFTGPPRSSVRMAFGPCMAMSRADYEATGGHLHPDVRSEALEDIAMARTFRRTGREVTVFAGRDLVTFRMHPTGPRQMVDSWTRSLTAGARRGSVVAFAGPFAWMTGALLASWCGGLAVASGDLRLLHAGVYLVWAAQMVWIFRRVGRFGLLTALFFPLPLLAFLALFVRSAILVGTGRKVRWRGRTVSGA